MTAKCQTPRYSTPPSPPPKWPTYTSTPKRLYPPTSSSIRVPNADEDSVLITETATTGTHGIYNNGGSTIATNDTYTMSVFAKAGTRNWLIIDHYTATTNYTWFDLSTGSVGTTGSGVTASIRDAGDGWYQCSVTRTTTSTVSIYIGVYLSTGDGVSSYLGASGTAYFYGLSITQGSNATYVPNPTTTSITSEVLLPQGLTAALNLDGASWAEVHDNASLDFGTGSFTLEAWVKAKYVNQGSGVNAALSLGGDGAAYSAMFVKSNNVFSFYYNGFFIDSSAQTEGDWVHIVGTYDETNQTLYIDGLQVAQNARGAADITNALVKQIGRDTNVRYYKDQIAQPRIYNRALTATRYDWTESTYNEEGEVETTTTIHPTWSQYGEKYKADFGAAVSVSVNDVEFIVYELEASWQDSETSALVALGSGLSAPNYTLMTASEARELISDNAVSLE
jgi:hypothetical protein